MIMMRYMGIAIGMTALSLMGAQDALVPTGVSNSYARVRGRLTVRPASPVDWPVVTVVQQLPAQNVQVQPAQAVAQPVAGAQPAAAAMARVNRLMGHLRS